MNLVFAGTSLALMALLAIPASAQESQTVPAQTPKAIETGTFEFQRPHQAAYTQNPEQPEYDTSKPVIGFGISSRENGMRIDVVLPGSAAKSAGLEVGMVILRTNGITMKGFETPEVVKILGAIDGEIVLDIEGRGRYSLIKAPIPETSKEN